MFSTSTAKRGNIERKQQPGSSHMVQVGKQFFTDVVPLTVSSSHGVVGGGGKPQKGKREPLRGVRQGHMRWVCRHNFKQEKSTMRRYKD